MARLLTAGRTAALVVTIAAVLGGCGGGETPSDRTQGTSLEETLASMPGVQGADVSETPAEDGAEEVLTQVAVDLEPDPEAADVVAVLQALVEEGAGRNATYVDSRDGWSEGVQPGHSGIRDAAEGSDLEAATQILLTGLDTAADLGGDAAIDVDLNGADTGPTITVLPASYEPDDVRAAEQAVTDDPVLSRAGATVLQEGFS